MYQGHHNDSLMGYEAELLITDVSKKHPTSRPAMNLCDSTRDSTRNTSTPCGQSYEVFRQNTPVPSVCSYF